MSDCITNSDTGKWLAALEDLKRDDIEEGARPDFTAEIERMESYRDRHWLNRILAISPNGVGAVDASELRILALQARHFEDRIREAGNRFAAELSRRSRVELTVEVPAVPAYLRAAT